MNSRFRRLALLAPLMLPLFFVGLAQAQTVWSQTANTCVVDNSDLNQYDQDSFGFRHGRRAEGTILARCPVTNPLDSGADPGWGTLEVVYRDPDGRDDRSQVRVRLIRVNNGGNTDNVAEFDSDEFPKLHFIEHRYADDPTNWWIPNRNCVEGMLRSAGFIIAAHPEPEVYLCRRGKRPQADGAVYPARRTGT